MKNYGTEFRKKEDKLYWVKKWAESLPVYDKIVVDDVRSSSDYKVIRRCNGIIIRIIKTGQVNTDTHQTESEIDSITPDYTIEANEGDHQKIYDELDKIIDQLNNK